MKLETKRYETRAEKRRGFWTGFGGWFAINIPLGALVWFSLASGWPGGSGYGAFGLGSLALMLNLVGLLVLLVKRTWMGVGVTAAMGLLMVLALCAGVGFLAWCFTQPATW